MNALNAARHALQRLIHLYRLQDENALRVEPYVLPVGNIDPQPKLRISKGYPTRFRGDDRPHHRVGLVIDEQEARWLHARLGELLADLPTAAEQDE